MKEEQWIELRNHITHSGLSLEDVYLALGAYQIRKDTQEIKTGTGHERCMDLSCPTCFPTKQLNFPFVPENYIGSGCGG